MKIQTYDSTYEKSWVYTKALSYLFSPFFDDMSRSKDEFTEEPYQDSVELIAVEDDQVVGLLDILGYIPKKQVVLMHIIREKR